MKNLLKKTRSKTFLKISLLLGIVLVSGVRPTFAQTRSDVALDISPGVQIVNIKPGEIKNHLITITQNGNLALQVTPRLVDISSNNQNGQPILLDNSQVRFVKIKNSGFAFNAPFELKPHSSQKIELEINPSNQTSLQEYPLAIVFETKPKRANQEYQIGSSTFANIATNLVIDVALNPPGFEGLQVKNIQIKQFIDSFRALKFKILIANQAKYSIPIYGRVTIADWSGKVQQTYHLANDVVLGDSNRYARNSPLANEELSKLDEDFIYKPSILLGPYTIRVELIDPNQNDQVFYSSSKTVLALPISIFIAILAGLATYFGYWWWSNKNSRLAKY